MCTRSGREGGREWRWEGGRGSEEEREGGREGGREVEKKCEKKMDLFFFLLQGTCVFTA